MKTSIRLALAFLALAGAGGTAAFAAEDQRCVTATGTAAARRCGSTGSTPTSSGDITFEEFSAAMKSRLGDADKDHDGKMSVAEIAQEIERMRAERMARRLVERFDSDGDGMLTQPKSNSRQKKLFALLDRNDDGKVVKDEMPRRKSRHGDGRF